MTVQERSHKVVVEFHILSVLVVLPTYVLCVCTVYLENMECDPD